MTVYDPYELRPRKQPVEGVLTEHEAWLYLAEHYADGPFKERGLCHAIDVICDREVITYHTRTQMKNRLNRTYWFRKWWRDIVFISAHFWPEDDVNSRIEACNHLAALSAEEEL